MSLLKPLVFGTPRLEYLKCVLKDPEFKQRAKLIHEKLNLGKDEKLAVNQSGDIVEDIYVPYIQSKKERSISKEIISLIGFIETDFELGPEETIDLMNGIVPRPEGEDKKVSFLLEEKPGDPPTKKLSMIIESGATKREMIESLNGIEKIMEDFFKTKPSKRVKGPQNYQLIYAVHRARRRGKKFSEIFTQYCLGTLDNYSGSRAMNSVDKFREYYRKYEPQEPVKTVYQFDLIDGKQQNIRAVNVGIDQLRIDQTEVDWTK